MKQKILFLDDDLFRHTSFKEYFSKSENVDIDYVHNYEEAVKALQETKYSIAYLDHDLSVMDHYCDPLISSHSKTGSDVVKFMITELAEDYIPTLVIIHSFNPVGAVNMQHLLNSKNIKNVWRPFSFHKVVVV